MDWVGNRRWAAGAVVVGVMLAAGCTSASGSGAAAETAAAPVPVLPSPAAAPSPHASTPITTPLPDLPSAARERSFAGAEAFVRHFVDTYSRAAAAGQAGVLTPYFAKSCRTCENIERALADDVAKNARFLVPPVSVVSISVLQQNPETPDEFQVLAAIREEENAVRKADGKVLERIPRSDSSSTFVIAWSQKGWIIRKIFGTDATPQS